MEEINNNTKINELIKSNDNKENHNVEKNNNYKGLKWTNFSKITNKWKYWLDKTRRNKN